MISLSEPTNLALVAHEARSWIEAHLPPEWLTAVRSGDRAALRAAQESQTAAWFEQLGESGLATPGWPVDEGGLGLEGAAAAVVSDELRRYDAGRPESDFPGLALAGPTIIEWGTPDQRGRYLSPLIRAKERWCQLFSEPGAGSDLAAITTRAVPTEAGGWRISGQKVWSSFAHISDFGMLMARSDFDLPKHRGITYFLLDMRSPGVSVRPLRQMNGEAEFNEVFLDDVEVPDSARLGPIGRGWEVALTTLMAERSGLSGRPAVGAAATDRLARRAQVTGAWTDDALRCRIMQAFVEEKVLQMATVRAFVEMQHRAPGAEGSIRKLAHADLAQALGQLAAEVEPFGLAVVDTEPEAADALRDFLSAKILSIAGGTSEIQRNIVGERVLGLPRENDPYKERPFRERPGQ